MRKKFVQLRVRAEVWAESPKALRHAVKELREAVVGTGVSSTARFSIHIRGLTLPTKRTRRANAKK